MAEALVAEPPTICLAYRYRLLTTKRQHGALAGILESQRQLYNAALEERIDCYRKTGKSLSMYDQFNSLTEIRKWDASLPLALMRGTLKRLDEAYKGFFRRLKSSGKAGFPRFKGKGWFDSFAFREMDGLRFDGKRVRFKGLPGGMRVHMHRALPSDAKILTTTFRRDAKGWLISFIVRVTRATARLTTRTIGIDLGLKSLAVLSDGTEIPNPRHARTAEREMRRRQRQLARCKRGSLRRRKVRARLARLHAKIANTRATYLHQVSAKLVRTYDRIAVEALNIRGLASGMLARSVNDAAWAKLKFMISYKVAKTGGEIIEVDPRNTTQECSGCGAIVRKTLAQREHSCSECGLILDRDHNAALNILQRAVVGPWAAKLGSAPVPLGNIGLEAA